MSVYNETFIRDWEETIRKTEVQLTEVYFKKKN